MQCLLRAVDCLHVGRIFEEAETRDYSLQIDGAQRQIQDILQQLHSVNAGAIDEKPINFVELDTVCGQIAGLVQQFKGNHALPLSHAQREQLRELQGHLDEALRLLAEDPIQSRLVMQRKAIQHAFPKLLHDPKALRFACESGLIYMMAMLRNAGEDLCDNDIGVQYVDQQVLFKVEGEFVPYEQLASRGITYDPIQQKIPGWTFVHPQGFIPRDSYDYEEIFPIAKLSEKKLREVQAQAKKFQESSSEKEEGEQDYVMQIVVYETPRFTSSVLKNFGEWIPENMHAALRIITPDGEVYSVGIKQRNEFENLPPSSSCSTRIAMLPIPDFSETRLCDRTVVTSIPISLTQKENIFETLHAIKGGIPFCFPSQNCVRTVTAVVSLAGISIDSTMRPIDVLWECLPNVEDLPFVGKAAATIHSIVNSFFRALRPVYAQFPDPVRKIVWLSAEIFSAGLKKLIIVALNLSAIATGGRTPIPSTFTDHEIRKAQQQKIEKIKGIAWFEQLLHWRDVFRDDAVTVYHSKRMIDWQKQQASTQVFLAKERPQFCIG